MGHRFEKKGKTTLEAEWQTAQPPATGPPCLPPPFLPFDSLPFPSFPSPARLPVCLRCTAGKKKSDPTSLQKGGVKLSGAVKLKTLVEVLQNSGAQSFDMKKVRGLDTKGDPTREASFLRTQETWGCAIVSSYSSGGTCARMLYEEIWFIMGLSVNLFLPITEKVVGETQRDFCVIMWSLLWSLIWTFFIYLLLNNASLWCQKNITAVYLFSICYKICLKILRI